MKKIAIILYAVIAISVIVFAAIRGRNAIIKNRAEQKEIKELQIENLRLEIQLKRHQLESINH